jgi:hypothetical protein
MGPTRKLQKAGLEKLHLQEYARGVFLKTIESDQALKLETVRFLRRAYGCTLSVTLIIILLQGFKLGGFTLPDSFLHWLGAATVGQIAGLFTMAFRSRSLPLSGPEK